MSRVTSLCATKQTCKKQIHVLLLLLFHILLHVHVKGCQHCSCLVLALRLNQIHLNAQASEQVGALMQ